MTNLRGILQALITCLLLVTASAAVAIPIRFLPWDDQVASRKIGFSTGEEVVEIPDLHPHKRSKAFAWEVGKTGPAIIDMDRTNPGGEAASEPLKLPAGIKEPLVLILPDNGRPSGLRCFVIEDAAGAFGWGNMRFLNVTGRELLVKLEKTVKSLPVVCKPVDFVPGGGSRNIGIQIAARDDLTAILYSSVWEHHPDVRKLVIVLPGADASTGALDVKVIPEDRRSAAPATASSSP
ncbi:MAG: hypothetical protein ACO3JG_00800 [Luteolibacter sp.]